MTPPPPLIIALEDHDRLLPLIEAGGGVGVAAQLEAELDRAQVLPLSGVPPDVVVMDSTLAYEDLTTGQRRELQLVFPHAANLEEGRVSVLVPLGCALLGLRVGQEIDWTMPGGLRRLRVLSVSRG